MRSPARSSRSRRLPMRVLLGLALAACGPVAPAAPAPAPEPPATPDVPPPPTPASDALADPPCATDADCAIVDHPCTDARAVHVSREAEVRERIVREHGDEECRRSRDAPPTRLAPRCEAAACRVETIAWPDLRGCASSEECVAITHACIHHLAVRRDRLAELRAELDGPEIRRHCRAIEQLLGRAHDVAPSEPRPATCRAGTCMP